MSKKTQAPVNGGKPETGFNKQQHEAKQNQGGNKHEIKNGKSVMGNDVKANKLSIRNEANANNNANYEKRNMDKRTAENGCFKQEANNGLNDGRNGCNDGRNDKRR
jgi:hypothetical protein